MFMLREKLGKFVEGRRFQAFVMVLIITNAVTLGLETVPGVVAVAGDWLRLFDKAVLAVFIFEILGKLIYRQWRFFLDGWNIFDFVIVGIALIPASGPLTVLRSLRVLRAFRLLSVVPSMRRVVQALLLAIPGIGSVGLLILLIFYVGAVISTKIFGAAFPEWFGTIGASMYTLFQIMTLESWSMGIVRPVMEVHPSAWAFFVIYILVTTFTMLNLFIAIIVNAMHSEEDQASAEREEEIQRVLSAEIRQMEARLIEEIRKNK